MMRRKAIPIFLLPTLLVFSSLLLFGAEQISFPSGDLILHGLLYKPDGPGPFPAVLYNHGSAAGMISNAAFEELGPVFARRGWVFFAPYRRGQGLSASAGPFIGEEIAAAEKKGGIRAGAATMVRLLETDHLNDQLAALEWLRHQPFIQSKRIAVAAGQFVRRHQGDIGRGARNVLRGDRRFWRRRELEVSAARATRRNDARRT